MITRFEELHWYRYTGTRTRADWSVHMDAVLDNKPRRCRTTAMERACMAAFECMGTSHREVLWDWRDGMDLWRELTPVMVSRDERLLGVEFQSGRYGVHGVRPGQYWFDLEELRDEGWALILQDGEDNLYTIDGLYLTVEETEAETARLRAKRAEEVGE